MRFHHQNAEIGDLRTERSPWRLGDLLRVTLLLGFVLAAYALGANNDGRSNDSREAEIASALHAAEQRQHRVVMSNKVAEAYERGLVDALTALRDTPDGVALAQACLAAGSR